MVKVFSDYIKQAITRWYINAQRDYGISGRFVSCAAEGDTLVIVWEEEGHQYRTHYRWFDTYSPEQVFNMWMEEDPENIEEVE